VIAGSTDTTNGVDLAAACAMDNEVAPILTYTFGSCEAALGTMGNAFYNGLWQQAAAEGITVIVATGDTGAAGCDSPDTAAMNGPAMNGAASTPYNIAVGGTEFAENCSEPNYWSGTNAADFSSALGYIPESAWNDSCDPAQPVSTTNCQSASGNLSLLAGGVGASAVYPKPGWQSGTGVPADGARDVPDVALAAGADHDDIVYCNSSAGAACQVNDQGDVVGLTLVGGTSTSTPAMAGILALVEQKNGTLQGQANSVLYKLAQSNSCDSSKQTNPETQNACVFYDVTAGSNVVPYAGGTPGCSSAQSNVDGFLNGEMAGPGYDLATGLGSVNAENLANDWKNVTFADSQTQLQMANATFAHGTAVTLNGTVAAANGSGTPTGTVSLKTDLFGNTTDTLKLSSGGFAASVSDLPGGTYNLFAHYAGDAMYGESDSPAVSLVVTPEASTTNINVSGLQNGSTTYGAQLPIRITVTGNSRTGIATGAVTLTDGSTTIGTYPLGVDGSAFILTGGGGRYSFAPGSHSLMASYTGDNSLT
jgi:subtilase family serine protease